MMFKNTLYKGLTLALLILINSAGEVLAKSSIKDLTSKKKAKQVKGQVSSYSVKNPSLPNQLKVHSFGLGLGQTFINGDFGELGEDKITWDFLYNYRATHSFDLLANFHHSKHQFKNSFVRLSGLNLGIKGKFYQFDSFSPYILGGLGFYNPKVRRDIGNGVLTDSKSKVVFGSNLGLGGELQLNRKFSIGILGQYHNPFDVQQELGPEVEGSYFKLLITTFYSL